LSSPKRRRGITLIELLIAMIMTAILGTAALSLMVSQGKFSERSEGQRAARRVGRSAINVLAADLRMVDPQWGIIEASPDTLTVNVPYALGIICASTASLQTILLLPVDSVLLALPGYSGYALRGNTGVYTPVAGGTVAQVSTSATCTGSPSNAFEVAAPSGIPNQRTRQITITTVAAPVATVGTPVMLYRRTRFWFEPSSQTGLTGRTALWRDYLDDGAAAVELAAPFDDAAAFRFYELDAVAAQTTVPASLLDITGFELFLPGESARTSRQQAAPEQADLTTSVFLMNRSD
jgi:type II secretory pathway pseudopilin PulG